MVFELSSVEEVRQLFSQYRIIVVKMHASWCQPCTFYGPKFAEIAEKYSSPDVVFVGCDVEKNPDLFKITVLPTTFIYVNGNLHIEINGAKTVELTNQLNSILYNIGIENPTTINANQQQQAPPEVPHQEAPPKPKNYRRDDGYSTFSNL